jgi:hypothetical protein
MLRRFSTVSIKYIVECKECRFLNKETNICKLNNVIWLNNRANEDICGLNGKKYWPIDKTYLEKSIKSKNNSQILFGMAFTSLMTACFLINDIKFMGMSIIFGYFGNNQYDKSYEYREQYEKDNQI